MQLKDSIVRICILKYLLHKAKLGYELKEQKDLCGEWNIQNYI